MDELDMAILRRLQDDARAALADIASEMGKPRTTIAARLSKLEKDGVVLGYKAVLNPFALGFNVLSYVLLSVKRGAPEVDKSIQYRVTEKILRDADGRDLPWVEEAHIITGAYDVLLKVWARDIRQLSRFLVVYLTSLPEIQRTETMIVLEIVSDWRQRRLPL